MSLSKSALKCELCGVGKGIYSCPRCSRKYCSSYCYKSREHESCSEAFFKDWVQDTLKEKDFDSSEKDNMLRILRKLEEESEDSENLTEQLIEDKFANLNINNLDEADIWNRLTKEEKSKFKSLLNDKESLEAIISLKQPWWTLQTLNLVTDLDSDPNNMKEDIAGRPPFPLNFKKLTEMTSTKPSSCISFNLVNVLYAYAFSYRFYNCDLRDFLDEVIDSLYILSPVLSEGHNYLSLVESVQDSIRLIIKKYPELPLSFVKGTIDDISNILLGPKNARPSTFVLCALHDVKLLLMELKFLNREKKDADKSLKKKLMLTVKKIEYYIGWSSEYENVLSEISSDLVLIMLPDLIPETTSAKEETVIVNVGKPLIEEVN